MANRTVSDAIAVRGTNPQNLVEKIIRSRIYESRYWKEECFALTCELVIDKIIELKCIGGCYGGNFKASDFICLLLKLLQIQPEKNIILELILNEQYKYMRALGAIYIRLTFDGPDCYRYLEPLYCDYRKLRYKNPQGRYEIIMMDEYIDKLLRDERVCDIVMPKIPVRRILEELDVLEPRKSQLDNYVVDSDEDMREKSDDAEEIEVPEKRACN